MTDSKVRTTSSSGVMSRSDAARIQSAEAKANGGKVAKGGFAARAQRAAAKSIHRKTTGSQVNTLALGRKK